MTWKQLTGQGNNFNIVHTTATDYSASVDELVVTEGDQVTLPTPSANDVVAVRNFDQFLKIVPSSGTIQGYDKRRLDTTDVVYLVSDGTDWYAMSENEYLTSVIPDSAVYRWTHSEGSGSTLGDSIGSNNGTVNGASWTSVSDAQDGFELSYDGSDDYVSFSTVSEVGVSQDFSIGLTVNPDSLTSDQVIWDHRAGSSDRVAIGISSSDNGDEIIAEAFDGSYIDVRGLGSDSETSRLRLLVTFDMTNNEIKIHKNAQNLDAAANSAGTLLSGSSGMSLGRRSDNSAFYGGQTDDLIIYNSVLSSSEIQSDYDLQPWS